MRSLLQGLTQLVLLASLLAVLHINKPQLLLTKMLRFAVSLLMRKKLEMFIWMRILVRSLVTQL
jgi:hypothetical protein